MIAPLTINRKLQFFASRARWGCRFRWFLTACALLSFAPWIQATINLPNPTEKKKSEKKKDATPPLPPQAASVAVQVPNGGRVQVALRVYGRQEQTTNYLIRKEPKFGRIVSLEPSEREVWILTYQHTSPMNGQLTQQDRILFAAQNKNGTSSAAEIVLNIFDQPPELAVAGLLNFGEIAAGIPATRNLTLTNQGGGVLEGNVIADVPWSVEPSNYRLEHGQQTTLRLTLLPETEREYLGRLHFSSDLKTEPTVSANACAPFTVEPAALQLAGAPKMARSATFTLTNRTAAELTLQVEASKRLRLPQKIVLPPHAVEIFQPTLAADDPVGMDGKIRLSMGGIFRTLSVQAASTVESKPEPPPKATPTPVRLVNLPFLPSPLPAAGPIGNLPEVDPAALNAAVGNALGRQDELPRITGFVVVQTTPNGTAEFAWDRPVFPSLGELTYRLEIRRLSLDANGKLLENWMAVPGVQISKKENRITALVTGIPLGIRDTAHIVAVTAKGEPCALSFPLPFHVPAPVHYFTLRNLLLAGFSLLLVAGLALQLKSKTP